MATKLGVRAIIMRGDKLVMVEHEEASHGKFFVFPGGGIEEDESIFEAAIREAKEETGLSVSAERILYVRETRLGGGSGIEFYVLCFLLEGELKLGVDPEKVMRVLSGVMEFSAEELAQKKWCPKELHGLLRKDMEDSFKVFRYLGICDIEK